MTMMIMMTFIARMTLMSLMDDKFDLQDQQDCPEHHIERGDAGGVVDTLVAPLRALQALELVFHVV